MEIWNNTVECIRKALEVAKIDCTQLEAVGITNQRESTLVWNKATGRCICKVVENMGEEQEKGRGGKYACV